MRRDAIVGLSDSKFLRIRRHQDFPLKRKRTSRRLIVLLAILGVVTLLAAITEGNWWAPDFSFTPEPQMNAIPDMPQAVAPDVRTPSAEQVRPASNPYHRTIGVTLKKGDNLYEVLRKEGIPASRIHELVAAARPVHNLRFLRQGQAFRLDFDKRDGHILRFETDIDEDKRLVVECEGEQLQARKEALNFEIHHQMVSGTIYDSLFLAADEADLPPMLTLALAEIFGWDIDFHVDIRSGDTFRVLFEEKYLRGNFAHFGRILAAVIVNQGHPFSAFYFEDHHGRSDYYDLEGRSLRKAFLKSPLKYARISSSYSHRRFHPILKIYRPHLGVDYAAPSGTPVRAIGDGRVAFAGWKNGYGRFIEIRHNETYTSTYGHLRRFAKGIRRGKFVSQGQLIGQVGTTGLSTGPHLDFRLLKNGRFINPLKVNFPDADPVGNEDMPDFRKCVARFLFEMERDEPVRKVSDPSLQRKAFQYYRTSS